MRRETPPVGEFSVTTSADHGVTVVAVGGEVDLLTVAALADAFRAASAPLVIDLCGCTFMDSTGVKTIVECVRRIRRVRIACVPAGPAARVLALTVGGQVPVHATRAEAVAASTGPGAQVR